MQTIGIPMEFIGWLKALYSGAFVSLFINGIEAEGYRSAVA
jgi:hypothetical protein